MTLTFEQMDALLGFGKPASKTADWIVNTYIPNAPVSYRLSIERAIAQAIVDAHTVQPGCPEGWQLVPKEPTKKMIAASCKGPKMSFINDRLAFAQTRTGTKFTELTGDETAMHEAYRAMLSAAPQEPPK